MMAEDEKKKSFSERFADYFMSIDLKKIIVNEFEQTLLPHIVDTLVDSVKAAFSNTIDELAYHGDKEKIKARRQRNGHMPYSSLYAGARNQPKAATLIGRPAYVVEDIVFTDDKDLRYGRTGKEKAEEVQRYLQNLLNSGRYDFVTVATLYGASHIPTKTWMENFGWYNISGMNIFQSSDGWVLRMPQPTQID